MPVKKKQYKKKAPYRRKPTTKVARINPNIILIPKPIIGGFPASVFTTLKYVESGSLNPTSGGLNAVQMFRANGLFDPNATGAGHQPRGFDEWMGIYDHYYVKRSKIVIEFHNSDATLEVMCGVALRDSNATETDPNDYQEQDGTGRLLGRVTSSKNHAIMTKYFNYGKQNFAKYVCAENKGTVAANPTEQGFYHCWVGQPWGSDAGDIFYTATIHYSTLFTELKDMPQS